MEDDINSFDSRRQRAWIEYVANQDATPRRHVVQDVLRPNQNGDVMGTVLQVPNERRPEKPSAAGHQTPR